MVIGIAEVNAQESTNGMIVRLRFPTQAVLEHDIEVHEVVFNQGQSSRKLKMSNVWSFIDTKRKSKEYVEGAISMLVVLVEQISRKVKERQLK